MSRDQETIADRADAYVVGLLEPAYSAAVEAEMEIDSALRTAVAQSRDRFLELDLVGPVRPVSPGLWSRIDTAIDARPADPAYEAGRPSPRAGNDNRVAGWRRAAYAAIASSLLLATGLAYRVLDAPKPQVIAVLVDDKGAPRVLVEDFGNASARVTPLSDFSVPADRSMQVWTLPSKEIGPTSLGLLDGWRTATLDGHGLPAPHEEQLYEITLEQPGGSPTGRPTGPILVKGFAKVPR
ncbi:anti-sigma factor [Mesorhizobium sp.]|uniref:anti-sigma factor n=1 Tax=Mesorhizobium sp. TaxID=1871066 RepID=UPI003BAB64F0